MISLKPNLWKILVSLVVSLIIGFILYYILLLSNTCNVECIPAPCKHPSYPSIIAECCEGCTSLSIFLNRLIGYIIIPFIILFSLVYIVYSLIEHYIQKN